MCEELSILAEKTVEILKKKNVTVSCAESCTGGMLAELITDISGASSIFELGIVSYSSRIKHKILSVDNNVLNTVGAVSEETARQMAENVRKLAGSDIAVSVTGVAGPSASEGKAPGTVYIALSAENYTLAERLNIEPKSRDFVRRIACKSLLQIIYNFVKDNY